MDLTRDIRQAAIRLLEAPALPLGAILAISIGLGGAIGIFRVIDASVVQPLELRDADDIFVVSERRPNGGTYTTISPDEFAQLSSHEAPLRATAVLTTEEVTLTSPGDPQPIRAARVSPSFFEVFDVVPIAGRQLQDDDAPGTFGHVAVVSEAFWRHHFGSVDLAGQQITIDSTPVTIVGVLPRGFAFPRDSAVWLPASRDSVASSRLHYLRVVARRLPSASDAAIRAYIDLVNTRRPMASGSGETHTLVLATLREAILGSTGDTLLLLGGAVMILLLLTACSVTNLLFARTWGRRREYSLEAALGASSGRLLVKPLWESAILAGPAGILAVLFAHLGLQAFRVAAGDTFPVLAHAGLDTRSALFAVAAAALMAFAAGILPAVVAVRRLSRVTGALVIHSNERQRLPHALAAIQMALALVLATGAGLFAKSLYRASAVDTGIAVNEVVTWRVRLPPSRYRTAAVTEFYRAASDRLRSLPQVRTVSAALVMPFTASRGERTIRRHAQQAADTLRVTYNSVGPNYFSAMGIPLLAGRQFSEQDAMQAANVTAVSSSLARALFGTLDAVGRDVVFDDSFGKTTTIVVAVVADAKTTRAEQQPGLQAYLPSLRSPRMTMVVRLRGEPRVTDLHALQTMARSVDPQVPVEFTPMADLLFSEISVPMLRTGLLIVFAGQAVLVAAISMVGLIRWRVSQRGAELALRVAVGATPGVIRRVLLRSELGWVLGGLVAGTVGTILLLPMAGPMLAFVDPIDPAIIGTAVTLLIGVALLAILPLATRITINAHGPLAGLREGVPARACRGGPPASRPCGLT